jgi:DNA polymerase-1
MTSADSSLAGSSATDAPPPRQSLYILDAFNYLYRAYHGLPPLTTSKGVATGAVYGLCQMILRIEREQKPSHLCAVFDSPGPGFRAGLYPSYKAHRPPMPDDLVPQIEKVGPVIDAFGIAKLSVPGFEADDVIATVAREAVAAGFDVVICSSDKDLMQLCGPHVALLDTMKNKRLGVPEVIEKFGVPPEQLGDVLALMGDSVDNVPGVPGIGPKTAAELIQRFGSLEELLAHASEVKGKRGEALVAHTEAVRLSRRLVSLVDDVPLPQDLASLHRVEPNWARIREISHELEFRALEALALQALGDSAAALPAPMGSETAGAGAAISADPAAGAPRAGRLVAGPIEPGEAHVLQDAASWSAFVEAARATGEVTVSAFSSDHHLPAVRSFLVGLGFVVPGHGRFYAPLGHRYLGGPSAADQRAAWDHLGPLFADPSVKKNVHDAKSLEVLVAREGHALRVVGVDTMILSYLLDASRTRHDLQGLLGLALIDVASSPKTPTEWLGQGRAARQPSDIPVEEAAGQVGLQAAVTQAVAQGAEAALTEAGLVDLYRDVELPLAGVLARIEARGILLDTDYLRTLGVEVARSLDALEKEIHQLAGTAFNINSNKQLADVLFGRLSLPVIRKTKTGPSTDADVLEELATLHAVPAKILEYRTLSKLQGTYIEALPGLIDGEGRLHTSFNQAVAATGRLSSSDPNLQNIPIRTEVGRRIRRAFRAKPGFVLVAADYSQIELRVLAHFSEDPSFLEAFRSGQDIHMRTAAEVFGLPVDSLTAEHRRVAKAINFGLVFGQTDFGLAQVLRIPRAEAKRYIDSFFQRYAGVRHYMETAIVDARRAGESKTLLGRRRPLPEIHAKKAQDRAYAERIARNTPIQGSAADLLKLAMLEVDRQIEAGHPDTKGASLLLTVHDELVFEVPEGQASAFSSWVKSVMESVYTLRVPLVVDVKHGTTWDDAKG